MVKINGGIIVEENEYIERLEKIIDKQDNLLTHLDAKFNQQQALNDSLAKQNQILREDIQKHKNLLRDMNKTVTQHKNVVSKLKKELEQQLKIQQDLHKDYGDVIKELTEELEAEKNNAENVAPAETNSADEASSKSNKVELPPKEHETDHVSTAGNLFNDIKDKSSEFVSESLDNNSPKKPSNGKKVCPNCGSEAEEGYVFCESCGTKLD
ncbi:zinc ribbon domain-containing protein [Methanobrevibacter sp.]